MRHTFVSAASGSTCIELSINTVRRLTSCCATTAKLQQPKRSFADLKRSVKNLEYKERHGGERHEMTPQAGAPLRPGSSRSSSNCCGRRRDGECDQFVQLRGIHRNDPAARQPPSSDGEQRHDIDCDQYVRERAIAVCDQRNQTNAFGEEHAASE